MRKTIEELKYNNEVCEIYTNSEMTNKFSVGYIIENDKDFFVCRAIDQYGAQDGWFCCLYDNIIRIQKETVYLKNLMKLYNRENNEIEKLSINNCESLLLQILAYIKKNNKLCSIELCNSNLIDAIGFISYINQEDSIIKIMLVDENGEENGESSIDIEMISCITVDSLDEKKIESLYKINIKR